MAKKQFDNIVASIARPQQRVSSMSELLDDEKFSLSKTDQPLIDDKPKEQERKEDFSSEYLITTSVPLRNGKDLDKEKESSESVIRDGFSMPSHDYQLISLLTRKAGLLGHSVNKSEVLRAGLQFLSKLSDDQFSNALSGVVKIKPGRKVSC